MNTNVGMRRVDRADDRRPVVLRRRVAGPLAPGAREDLVGHQHRHVAADAVALRGDRDQRVDRRRAQAGRERVELDDVGPRREVGVLAVRERAVRKLADPQVSLAWGARSSRGGRARRGSARSRGSAAARAGRARPAPWRAPPVAAEARVERVAGERSTPSRSRRRRAGRAAPGAKLDTRSGLRCAIASPAGLRSPDAHQPHGVDAQRGEPVPLLRGHGREPTSRPSCRPRSRSQTAVLIS